VTVAGRAGDRFAVGRLAPYSGTASLTTVDFGAPSAAYGLLPVAEGVLAVGTAGGDFAIVGLNSGLNPVLDEVGHGRVRTSFGAEAVARSVAEDDKAIMVAGTVKSGRGSSVAIAPYAAGGPDLGFGVGGKVIDDVTAGDDAAYAVLPGNFVAGKAAGSALLARYQNDGTPDPIFGTAGKVLLDLSPGEDVVYAAIADGGGSAFRYIVAGSAGPDAFVARFHGDGRPDVAFGTQGVVRIPFGGTSARITGIDSPENPAVAFLLSGVVMRAGGDDAALARITPDGKLDPAFGTAGVVVADLGGPADQVAGATTAWWGNAPGGGPIALAGGDGRDAIVVTFDAGGRRVATKHLGFGAPSDDSVRGSSRSVDGKTLVLGMRVPGGPFLARFLPDGSPDPSFGPRGLVDPALGATLEPRALTVASDGRILVLLNVPGRSTEAIAQYFLARFLADGRLDNSYGTDGVAKVGFNTGGEVSITTLPGGRVLVALDATIYPITPGGQRDMAWNGGLGYGWINNGGAPLFLGEPSGTVLAFYDDGYCHGLRVERYNADGTHILAWCGARDFVPSSVLRRPDGRILVAGTTGAPSFDNITNATLVASFLPSGAPDASFGAGRPVRLDLADKEVKVQLALGPAGTVVFAAEGRRRTTSHVVVGRLLADGRVDRSFGTGGTGQLAAASSPDGVGVQSDGKVVIAATVPGDGGNDMGLLRYSPSGQAFIVPRSMGWNPAGMLGIGTTIDSRTPLAPLGLSNVRHVAAGWYHSLAVLDDGSVWAWGWNGLGQLGTASPADAAVPTRVTGLPPVVAVAAGALHSMALGVDGSVWVWGWNGVGQLGTGTTDSFSRPVVAPMIRVSGIAAGAFHSLALRTDGVVWAWGWNVAGQLGDSTAVDHLWPNPVVSAERFVKIAAGAYHSLGVTFGGEVATWGYNVLGQLGTGQPGDAWIPTRVPGLKNAVDVAGGGYHSLAVTTKGVGDIDSAAVWAWGWNGYGQLGDGTTTDRPAPVAVPNMAGVQRVSAGLIHSAALGAGGALWTWGWNGFGQLGDGTTVDRAAPSRAVTIVDATTVAAGGIHTLAG